MRAILVGGAVLAAMVVAGCAEQGPQAASVTQSAQLRPVRLFNGTDLSGWEAWFAEPGGQMEEAFRVSDGAIICSGRPIGFLRTQGEYADYLLSFEWRWAPGGQGGNSGVMIHCSTPRMEGPWPRSLEVQLKAGDAGDFYEMASTYRLVGDEGRKQGRRGVNLLDDVEKPIGHWNRMEITCRGAEVIVKVNGRTVNHAVDCSETRGYIAFQNEGTEIHFRDITLTPLAGPRP